jgi:hypothetical protein
MTRAQPSETWERDRDVVVRLSDGPCAGTYATVKAFGEDCWQRLGNESVMLRYIKNLYEPGEYVWSGDALTDDQLVIKMKRERDTQGAVFGRSHGA